MRKTTRSRSRVSRRTRRQRSAREARDDMASRFETAPMQGSAELRGIPNADARPSLRPRCGANGSRLCGDRGDRPEDRAARSVGETTPAARPNPARCRCGLGHRRRCNLDCRFGGSHRRRAVQLQQRRQRVEFFIRSGLRRRPRAHDRSRVHPVDRDSEEDGRHNATRAARRGAHPCWAVGELLGGVRSAGGHRNAHCGELGVIIIRERVPRAGDAEAAEEGVEVDVDGGAGPAGVEIA